MEKYMEERVYNPQSVDINLLRNKCGVYQIRNKKNNKVILGAVVYYLVG